MARWLEHWGLSVRNLIFPPVTGRVCEILRTGLTGSAELYAADVTVQPNLPDTKTARMVTVRDDSGPDDGVQSRRRYGFNVWAVSAIEAEKLALLCMAILRNAADGAPITLVDLLSGPYEIEDVPQLTVGSKNLSHYFFTGRISVRGSNFPTP